MTENPYETPGSDLDVVETPEQRPIRGIVMGLVADLAGTTICSVILVSIYATMLFNQGMNAADVEEFLRDPSAISPLYVAISTVLGLSMSWVGGYVCIRVSNGVDLTNAMVLGVITFLVGILIAWDAYDPIEFIVLSAVGFLMTLWGGRTAASRRVRGATIEV